MSTIIREIAIEAGPERAWEALRDFAAVDKRLAPGFLTDSRLESPDTRVVTFFNGAVARERLIGIDDGARRLAYSVIESRLNTTHHNAAAQIVDAGDGASRFVWTVDVLPDAVAGPISELMDAGLAAIKATLDRDGAVS